jgi:hypothetical protein
MGARQKQWQRRHDDREQRRRHSRAPVHEFVLTWWKKHGEEFQVAMRERNRSKVGRMARLRGEVDKVDALEGEQEGATHSELAERLEEMRQQAAEEPVS